MDELAEIGLDFVITHSCLGTFIIDSGFHLYQFFTHSMNFRAQFFVSVLGSPLEVGIGLTKFSLYFG